MIKKRQILMFGSLVTRVHKKYERHLNPWLMDFLVRDEGSICTKPLSELIGDLRNDN